MIKKYLMALVDARLFVCLAIIVALSIIVTMLFSDKVKDFDKRYKKKFYGYVLSFVLLYAVVAFLGFNKLFVEISDEFLFYQMASLLFGVLHVWLYRSYFEEFKNKAFTQELLFALLIPLYSTLLFMIIYTALNGIDFTFLMCSHFVVFAIPTGIYMTFNFMMEIPQKKFVTWTPNVSYEAIKSEEMEGILLITLLIRKEESDEEYISIRAQAPVKVDFGRLFFLALQGYNRYNESDQIELKMPDGKDYNWVFYLQSKWYEKNIYVDANHHIGISSITENSVVICQREAEKGEVAKKKKKVDEKVYNIDTLNEASKNEKIEVLKEEEISEGGIK